MVWDNLKIYSELVNLTNLVSSNYVVFEARFLHHILLFVRIRLILI